MESYEYQRELFAIQNDPMLSEEERASLLSDLEAQKPEERGPVTKTSLLQDIGLGAMDLLYSTPVLGDTLENMAMVDFLKQKGSANQDGSFLERLDANLMQHDLFMEQRKREALGIPAEAEQGFGGRLLRASVDPMMLVGPGKKLGAVLGVNVAPNVAQNALTVGAGQIIDSAFPNMSYAARELATMIAGTATNLVTGAGINAVVGQVGQAKGLKDSALEAFTDLDVKTKLASVKQHEDATGGVAGRLQYLKDMGEIAGIRYDDFTTGLVNAIDNPHVEALVRSYSSMDPEFNSAFLQYLEDKYTNLRQASDEILGSMDPQDLKSLRQAITDSGIAEERAAVAKKEAALAKVDADWANLSEKIQGDPSLTTADIGTEARNVLDAREAYVRENITNPAYAKATEGAKQRGTVLVPEEIGAIYAAAKNVDPKFTFVAQSPIAKKILEKWAPDLKSKEFPQRPIEEIVSLDQQVNRMIRANRRRADPDPMQEARLTTLKEAIDATLSESIAARDAQFSLDYKEAKDIYRAAIAGPLRDTSLSRINSRTLSTAVFDTFGNIQRTRDYLAFTGEAGAEVARKAFRLHLLGKRDVNTGLIPQSAINELLKDPDKSAVLRQLGMYDEVRAANTKIEEYVAERSAINEAFAAKTDNETLGFFKAVANKDIPGVVGDMLTNPSKRDSYVSAIERLPKKQQEQIHQSLRREFKQKAETSSVSLAEFVLNNEGAARAIFGNDHYTNLVKLAKAEDHIARMANSMLAATVHSGPADALSAKIGVPVSTVIGTLRNQILSAPRKVINLASVSLSNKGKALAAQRYQNILLDADIAATLADPKNGLLGLMKQGKEGVIKASKVITRAVLTSTEIKSPETLFDNWPGAAGAVEGQPQVPYRWAERPVTTMERAGRAAQVSMDEEERRRRAGMLLGDQ